MSHQPGLKQGWNSQLRDAQLLGQKFGHFPPPAKISRRPGNTPR
jgi:hypothetical protein